MDHIVNPIVVTGGYKYFLTFYPVIAFIRRHSHGGDIRQGRAGFGLGQRHGALPLTGAHPGYVSVVQFLAAEGFDQMRRTECEAGVSIGRVIGGCKNKLADIGYQTRQLFAILVERDPTGDPATLPEFLHDGFDR